MSLTPVQKFTNHVVKVLMISLLGYTVISIIPKCEGNVNAHQAILLQIKVCEDKDMRSVFIRNKVTCHL